MKSLLIPPSGNKVGGLNRSFHKVKDGRFTLDWAVVPNAPHLATVDVWHVHKFIMVEPNVPKVLHIKKTFVPIMEILIVQSYMLKQMRHELDRTVIYT